MCRLCNLFLVFIFIFLPFSLIGQETMPNLKKDVFSLMKNNTTSKNKKKAKKFFRILKSKDFSSELNFQIKLVLLDFQERNLGFHSHYVNFFDLVIECEKNQENKLLLNNILGFLISRSASLSNLDLRQFLSRLNDVFKYQILSKKDEFMWKYSGDFQFIIEENDLPGLYFSKADLILCNQYDTVQLFNAKGYYDILDQTFKGDAAEAYFVSEDIFADFVLNDFQIDLNKQFFHIDKAILFSEGAIDLKCTGRYKNKLTSSKKYPVFISDHNDLSFAIFDNIGIVSGFELKGSHVFFNRLGSRIDMSIKDDSMDYFVTSNYFELTQGKISASNSRFVVTNKTDSIYHPTVKFSYNDYEQKIFINRISGSRGLSPIRNTFHGLHMFVDRLEIDLVYDNCLLFHYAPGRDIEVLFESDNYFDKTKYNDLFRFDINVFGLLFEFLKHKNDSLIFDNYDKEYAIKDFASFNNLKFSDAWDILIEFEIFNLLDCYRFGSFFKIKPWAFHFIESIENQYDYDAIKIESLAAIGDTVAEIDLYLNTMDIYRVNKVNLTNRFPLTLYPMSNKLKFFTDKSFFMDGNIYVGNFAFSGKDVRFDYDDFAFHFGPNSVLSFLKPELNELSSSLIHFDNGVLFVDSINNKSGLEKLNNFPKFQIFNPSFLSYGNDPVQFLIDPLRINYLYDMSLENLSFPGVLYLDGDSVDAPAVLVFNESHNLETAIIQDSLDLYRNELRMEEGGVFLNEKGLFATGNFSSEYLNFFAKDIELSSGKMTGLVSSVSNGQLLSLTPFEGESILLHYSPYDHNFLVKTINNKISLYNNYSFEGDLYFDGKNLNGSGGLEAGFFSVESSHYYFSSNNIMSADADFVIYDRHQKDLLQLDAQGVSLEYIIDDNIFFISNSTHNFSLPRIDYLLDFEFMVFDVDSNQLSFSNNNSFDQGDLISLKYGKSSFLYHAINAEYSIDTNVLCVSGDIQLNIKKFRLKPENDEFCLLGSGNFPIFKNANLIKKRWLLKDKIIHNKDVQLMPSLKHSIIND